MTLAEELLELADEISLGDLLESPLTRDATIRAINNVHASMLAHPLQARTPKEMAAENRLSRLRAAIPPDAVEQAYRKGRDLYVNKQKVSVHPRPEF